MVTVAGCSGVEGTVVREGSVAEPVTWWPERAWQVERSAGGYREQVRRVCVLMPRNGCTRPEPITLTWGLCPLPSSQLPKILLPGFSMDFASINFTPNPFDTLVDKLNETMVSG